MTNLEAADLLDNLIGMASDNHDSDYDEALSKGRDILKSEPCEDCVSRIEALNSLDKVENKDDWYRLTDVMKMIRNLPPVTPQPKTGHWKEVYAETDYRNGWIEFSCENCEYQHGLESGEYGWSYGDPIPWKYCPICGAKMVEPQESEG